MKRTRLKICCVWLALGPWLWPSWALADSLWVVVHPSNPVRGLTPQERRSVGIGDGLVRLSVGIEDPADLFADLERGLRAAAASPISSVAG